MPFSQYTAQLFGSGTSTDILIVLALFGAALMYGFFVGRNRVIIAIVATYLALVLFPVLPLTALLKKNVALDRAYAVDIGVFLGLIIVLYILLQRSVVRSALKTPKHGDGGLIQVGIFSILAVGLILAYGYAFLPAETQATTAPFLNRVLFSDTARFWWTLIPLGGLLAIRNKGKEA
ncbi:MAG: hypothetical protein Q8R13_04090 [bacterium]|nr:hypothetical protein [bacterium]MDZ4296422.1 hypothetical protein [Patescibacteria group bacterium]